MAIVYSGDLDTTYTRMFGAMHPETAHVIQTNINTLTQQGQQVDPWFYNTLMSQYKDIGLRSITIAQNNMDYMGDMFQDNITRLTEVLDFKLTTLINQQYMVANPYFYNEMEKGRIEGWGVEFKPSQQGEFNPYYRAAINGLMQYGDEQLDGSVSDEDVMIIDMNDYDDEDVPQLTTREQLTIRDNWTRLYNLINYHADDDELVEDPTSLNGAYLG